MPINPPYNLYKQQKEYITDAVEFLKQEEGKYLLQEGPTGMGKTVCNLMEALHWISKLNHRVVYFSREHEQINQCITDLNMLLRINETDVKAVHIAGRSISCIRPEVLDLISEEEQLITCEELHATMCDYSKIRGVMEHCEAPKGHIYTFLPQHKHLYYEFDVSTGDTAIESITINDHLQLTDVDEIIDELFEHGIATNDLILQIAEKYIICPRKLQELAMEHANIIFAPYNYMVLSRIPTFTEVRYFFIIDEAHNLDQNLLQMESFKINKSTFRNFLVEVDRSYRSEAAFLESTEVIMTQFTNMFVEDRDYIGEELKRALKDIDQTMFERMQGYINMYARRGVRRRTIHRTEDSQTESYRRVSKSFLSMQRFCNSMQRMFASPYTGVIKIKDNYVYLRFVNVDKIFADATVRAVKVVISSGTLYPKYMAKYLGIYDNSIRKTYKPPHTRLAGTAQIIASVDDETLNTRFKERSLKKFKALSKAIAELYSGNPNGTLVFYPSYTYMNGVGTMLEMDHEIVPYTHERIGNYRETIAEGERAMFATAFRGKGSEGWNFPDDQSRAIILVGTPYMPMDIMVKAQMEYYDSLHLGLGNIWYKEKAVLWLMQAMGRGIRHKDDWTKVYFLDDRIHNLKRFFIQWVKQIVNWRPKYWTGAHGR